MSASNQADNARPLRYGWTTGACATAAARAALQILTGGGLPRQVEITLPKGQQVTFDIAQAAHRPERWASAGVIKDAGDDPDVTHGALIIARIRPAPDGSGITFRAGHGVGTVTLPGLPLAPGEPAINPVPRAMITQTISDYLAVRDMPDSGFEVEISIPGGERLAARTWNPRLGIRGGLSILGTTGIVVPYSCSAWIHSIHRGIDVARATHRQHIGAAVGATSQALLQRRYPLPDEAIIDMGDFVGGMLKYLRRHPVPALSIAGGFGKISKLANGAMDLHSKRSQVDIGWLAQQMATLGAAPELVSAANSCRTALAIQQLAQHHDLPLADHIARLARARVITMLRHSPVDVDLLICDRNGNLIGQAGFSRFIP